ncbi:MAG TPA: hypothetical protein DEQ47_01455 [Solibacterales bacterium]|nr:hypothetical protein [Bryobacterales bacterium]
MSYTAGPFPATAEQLYNAARPAVRQSRTAYLVVFLAGLLCCIQSDTVGITLIGQIYIGEVFLAVYAFWSVLGNLTNRAYWERPFVWALVTLGISFSAYIFSDLLNQTPLTNLLRGWARMAFLASDLIALNALTRRHPLRILAFITGMAVGFLVTVEKLSFDPSWYKIGIATPALLITLSLFSIIRYRYRYALVVAVWTALGVLNFFLDFRSMGATCLLCGAVTLAKMVAGVGLRSLYAIVLAFSLAIAVAAGIYSYITTQDVYGERRSQSNSWRVAAAEGAIYGISQSPWIGNGSWARTSDTDAVIHATFAEVNGKRLTNDPGVAGHSQILQVWYEAGVLALVFFTFVFIFGVKTLWDSVFHIRMNELFGVTLYFTFNAIISYFISPFGGLARFFMALSLCLFMIQGRLLRQQRASLQRSFIGLAGDP